MCREEWCVEGSGVEGVVCRGSGVEGVVCRGSGV